WISAGKSLKEVRHLDTKVKENLNDYFHHTEMCWTGYLGQIDCDIDKLPKHARKMLKRSILVIRGQTNNNGAITAANDSTNLEFNQDKYGYVWPRDGALIAETMAEAGYEDLVRPFYDLMEDLIEEEGYLLHKYNPDGTLGSSWHPWIDENGEKQLPIQEDETALVIWSLKRFYEETSEKEILKDKWDSLIKPAAEFLADYFDEETGLPKPSYDLWEERRYISTFTVASVYAGLKAASEIAEIIGKENKRFEEKANMIKEKGLPKLKSDELKRYGRGLKEGDLDKEVSAPLIFLWKFNLVDEEDEYFRNTFNAIRYDLSPDTEIGGIARYKGDQYHNVSNDFEKIPGNPWIICTLWVAQFLISVSENKNDLKEAKELMHWTFQNSTETGLLPEQINPKNGEPLSVAPLTWSHSAFIDTAFMYAEKKEEIE
ncbi:MAG: glycoside hydrolase family 15 protein, partial [Candidatus Nanohaloarchaea archaeon]